MSPLAVANQEDRNVALCIQCSPSHVRTDGTAELNRTLFTLTLALAITVCKRKVGM